MNTSKGLVNKIRPLVSLSPFGRDEVHDENERDPVEDKILKHVADDNHRGTTRGSHHGCDLIREIRQVIFLLATIDAKPLELLSAT
jgi:hypothetical protein